MVISEAGNDPKVAGLVYVAAIVPDEGQAASDVLKPYAPGPGLGEAKPDASGFLSLTRKGIDEDFVPDLRQPKEPNIYAIQGAWNSACLAEKVSVPAWKTKPSWFIIAATTGCCRPSMRSSRGTYSCNNDDFSPPPCANAIETKTGSRRIIEAANTPFTASDAAHANAKFTFPTASRLRKFRRTARPFHVRVGGQGPAVVLIHGFGFTGDMWAPLAAELAATTESSFQTCAAWGFPHIPRWL